MIYLSNIAPRLQRRHDGKVTVLSGQPALVLGRLRVSLPNGEPLCQTFALDCCDREAMCSLVTTGGHSGNVVRDVMLATAENRFGATLKAPEEIEWLTDNGSGSIAKRTRMLAAELGVEANVKCRVRKLL